jgi:hypothetical protein
MIIDGSEIAAFVQDVHGAEPVKRKIKIERIVERFLEWRDESKGPATVAAVPSHGSTIPGKDTEMNEVTNTTAAPAAPVTLTEAIRLYKRGLAEFNFRTFDVDDDQWDDLVRVTYGPHYEMLSNWDTPATTAEEAFEALQITLTDEGGVYGCEAAVSSMVKAAYGYLRGLVA